MSLLYQNVWSTGRSLKPHIMPPYSLRNVEIRKFQKSLRGTAGNPNDMDQTQEDPRREILLPHSVNWLRPSDVYMRH